MKLLIKFLKRKLFEILLNLVIDFADVDDIEHLKWVVTKLQAVFNTT